MVEVCFKTINFQFSLNYVVRSRIAAHERFLLFFVECITATDYTTPTHTLVAREP